MTSDLITRLSKLDAPDDAERRMRDQIWLAKFIQSRKRIVIHRDHALLESFTNYVRENIKRRQALLRAKEASNA
ncbi:hypothetical protein [Ochrobactrum sp. MC-1LL]|uniref:hypothetical protein n=1 Tax=Ochrobactrum sp. MC-1LL TaxID=2735351 RepID=UPI00143866F6|nr:hypothetical protein [Ochrobactrum sp. MC-1LL]NKE75365.1 hypothetical protein [Ochrobactrum sp. MC-1LL]NKE77849.1 hypothetical protein [Ochrobactrum sp. MC-1LL]